MIIVKIYIKKQTYLNDSTAEQEHILGTIYIPVYPCIFLSQLFLTRDVPELTYPHIYIYMTNAIIVTGAIIIHPYAFTKLPTCSHILEFLA